MSHDEKKWITENYKDIYKMSFKVNKKLYSKKSSFQKVEVYDTDYLGRVLLNDDFLMTSDKDEFVYHEMISHVPLFSHPDPKKVLVVGGGDGGTVREVLKHKSVEAVVMVEIDTCVVEACKSFVTSTSCELENPRLNLIIDDAVEYLKTAEDNSFDVILIDSSDPIGPAAPLFGEEFYSDVKRALTPNGIVVSQCENPFLEIETQGSLLEIKSKFFDKTYIYNYSNVTYPSGLWSFSVGTLGDIDPRKALRTDAFQESLKYYNSDLHRACFCLPQFQQKFLNDLIHNNSKSFN